jgi:hypothetical protein
MKSPGENGVVTEAEMTLRLIAVLPAPEGLEGRVQANLQAEARAAKRGRILHWPMTFRAGGWMYRPALRGAAAAAIVCVVAGGGWRIYSHVQAPAPEAAKVIVLPARVGNQGTFSNSGAMRTPDTLTGPVLTHSISPDADKAQVKTKRHKVRHSAPVQAQPVEAHPAQPQQPQ